MLDTIMQYTTSLGMLACASIVGYKLIRDELNYRRWKAEIEQRAKHTFEEYHRNKRS